jgi:hypothetical protein
MDTFVSPKSAPILESIHEWIKSSMKMLKRKGESMPPCLTPQFIENSSNEVKLLDTITPVDES